jgi:hypothetical protein
MKREKRTSIERQVRNRTELAFTRMITTQSLMPTCALNPFSVWLDYRGVINVYSSQASNGTPSPQHSWDILRARKHTQAYMNRYHQWHRMVAFTRRQRDSEQWNGTLPRTRGTDLRRNKRYAVGTSTCSTYQTHQRGPNRRFQATLGNISLLSQHQQMK